MANFGWSLPAGCGTLPGEEAERPDHQACPHCGTRLSWEPSRTESYEIWEPTLPDYVPNGPRRVNPETGTEEVLLDAVTVMHWTCPNCGVETDSPEEVFWDDIIFDLEALHIPEIQAKYADCDEWEIWAPSGDATGLLDLVKNMIPAEHEEINRRDWYFLEVNSNVTSRTTVWLDGLGGRLALVSNPYLHTLLLNHEEIARQDRRSTPRQVE